MSFFKCVNCNVYFEDNFPFKFLICNKTSDIPHSIYMAEQIVIMHDEKGLDFHTTLDMCEEQKIKLSLIGILGQASRRNLSKKLLKDMVLYCGKRNASSKIEQLAVDHFSQ